MTGAGFVETSRIFLITMRGERGHGVPCPLRIKNVARGVGRAGPSNGEAEASLTASRVRAIF